MSIEPFEFKSLIHALEYIRINDPDAFEDALGLIPSCEFSDSNEITLGEIQNFYSIYSAGDFESITTPQREKGSKFYRQCYNIFNMKGGMNISNSRAKGLRRREKRSLEEVLQ